MLGALVSGLLASPEVETGLSKRTKLGRRGKTESRIDALPTRHVDLLVGRPATAFLQRVTDMILPGVPASAAPNAAAPAKPVSGATVYLVDQSGNLGTLDLGTRAVHVIFNTHQHLTDIAFSPTGKLYAVSFKLLFQIDPRPYQATYDNAAAVLAAAKAKAARYARLQA